MRHVLHRVVYAIVRRYSHLRWVVRNLLGGVDPVQILPYLGYGTVQEVIVSGRAVAQWRVEEAQITDSLWRNVLNTARRFTALSIPETRVRARLGTAECVALTNTRGYFRTCLPLETPLPDDTIWHEVELTLLDYPDQPGAHVRSQVIVPGAHAAFGVISDLDDTVIQTGVINKLKTVLITFTRNAHTRLSFPGVAAFYHALQQGVDAAWNPLFYISTSPNTLYDMLMAFLRLNHIPAGPMFLITMGMTKTHFFRPGSRRHKLRQIRHIMDMYATLPFVLIGDSGEEDPEIYLDTLQHYPGRVLAIYIRDVARSRHGKVVRRLGEQARQMGVDLLFVQDTLAAAQHAAQHGYIAPEAVAAVYAEICAAQ